MGEKVSPKPTGRSGRASGTYSLGVRSIMVQILYLEYAFGRRIDYNIPITAK